MKACNGGQGMSDEAVKLLVTSQSPPLDQLLSQFRFVNRYIPGYVFFGGGQPSLPSRWPSGGLRLFVDETRQLIGVEEL